MGSLFSHGKSRKNDNTVREKNPHSAAEEGRSRDLSERTLESLQMEAIISLQKGKLTDLMKPMEEIVTRKKLAQKKSNSVELANVKVFKVVKHVKKIIKNGRQVTVTEMVDEEIKLKWSDRLWKGLLKHYAKVMEGIIPIAGIPVGGNAVNNFMTPIVMVGIPKWIRCPPSIMFGLWRTWFLCTLTAYIPIWGTYRFLRRAPISSACRRISTYLLLRKLLSDSVPVVEGDVEYSRRKKKVTSRHLTEYLGQEVTYPLSMDRDIDGTWRSCCSCLW